MNEPELEPWQWTEQHWRKVVNQVRAGRRLHPTHWKDNARCAVALSFDSDHETNELRDGGKSIGRFHGVNTAIESACRAYSGRCDNMTCARRSMCPP